MGIPLRAPGFEDASPTDDPFCQVLHLCDKLWLPRWAGTCLQSLHLCCAVGQRPCLLLESPLQWRAGQTHLLGSPGSWPPLRVRVGVSSKAVDMLMHAGPSFNSCMSRLAHGLHVACD